MSLARVSLGCLLGWVLGCSGGSGLPDAAVIDSPPPSGRFALAWSIEDGARVLSCDEVGALIVSVEVSGPDIGGGYVEAFTCGGRQGTSKALPAGTYDLTFELVGRSGSLGTLPSQRITVRADQVAPVGPVTFPVVASGTFDARFVAGVTANCTPAGANIAALSLVLERQGGACVPTTFAIAAGATRPATTYVSSCVTPTPVAPCIERDQAVTAVVGSGPYVVRVRGTVGASLCWSSDQLADVPPAGRTLRVDISLTSLKGTAGCP